MPSGPPARSREHGDGPRRPVSPWLDGREGGTRPRLERDVEVEVAVVGGGIVGLTTALLLSREGIRVVVLEGRRVGAGVTGHTTAKVTSLHGLTYARLAAAHGAETARAYGEANEAGLATIVGLTDELEIDCDLRRRPNLTYTEAPAERGEIEDEVAAALAAGLPASYVETTDLPFDIAAAVRFSDQAELHPLKYLDGLAAAIEGCQARIYERTRATGVSGNDVLVEGGRRVRAERVIVATPPAVPRPGTAVRAGQAVAVLRDHGEGRGVAPRRDVHQHRVRVAARPAVGGGGAADRRRGGPHDGPRRARRELPRAGAIRPRPARGHRRRAPLERPRLRARGRPPLRRTALAGIRPRADRERDAKVGPRDGHHRGSDDDRRRSRATQRVGRGLRSVAPSGPSRARAPHRAQPQRRGPLRRRPPRLALGRRPPRAGRGARRGRRPAPPRRLSRRGGDPPLAVGAVPASGMHRRLERRRADLGLPLPRLAVRPSGDVLNGPATQPLEPREPTEPPGGSR